MYEPSNVVPSEHDELPEPDRIAAILRRVAVIQATGLLPFVPGQLRESA
jgi:hypothetical protein